MRLRDLAKLAGVSKTTVSYILSGKGNQHRISLRTQDKVWALANQYNYKPNTIAKALRMGRSQQIGVVLPDLHEPKVMKYLARIEKLSRELGYHLLISCSEAMHLCAEDLYREMLMHVDIAVLIKQRHCQVISEPEIYVEYLNAEQRVIDLVEETISSLINEL